jgi:hypothetical protein
VALLQQKEETNKLQKEMILGKQKQVEQTEFINQIENKLSSMKRYKTLAVESGQFHNAKKLNEQIKMMEKELTNAKEENKNKTDDGTTYWQEAKSKLEKIKLEHEDLEYQLGLFFVCLFIYHLSSTLYYLFLFVCFLFIFIPLFRNGKEGDFGKSQRRITANVIL